MTSKTKYDPHNHQLFGFPIDPERGPRKNLCNGGSIYVLDPKPEDMEIEIIARGASNLCRFGGQLKPTGWFSVADHSMLVMDIVTRIMGHTELAHEALLHDADEPILGFDIPTPVKAALDLLCGDAWRALPDGIKRAVAERWELRTDPEAKAIIKEADRIAMSSEKRDFLDPESFVWSELLPPVTFTLQASTREEARFRMVTIHYDLCRERGIKP